MTITRAVIDISNSPTPQLPSSPAPQLHNTDVYDQQ